MQKIVSIIIIISITISFVSEVGRTSTLKDCNISPNPIFTNETIKYVIDPGKESDVEIDDERIIILKEREKIFSSKNIFVMNAPSQEGQYNIGVTITNKKNELKKYYILPLNINDNNDAKLARDRANMWDTFKLYGFAMVVGWAASNMLLPRVYSNQGEQTLTQSLYWVLGAFGWWYFAENISNSNLSLLKNSGAKETNCQLIAR